MSCEVLVWSGWAGNDRTGSSVVFIIHSSMFLSLLQRRDDGMLWGMFLNGFDLFFQAIHQDVDLIQFTLQCALFLFN